MSKYIYFKISFDDDWNGGKIYLPEGILLGYVTLKISRRLIIDKVCCMNASAVSLLKTLKSDHIAATSETEDNSKWPLFFCAGSLWNRCGVISDFTVRRNGEEAVLSNFLRCDVSSKTVLRIPWPSWSNAVTNIGRSVLLHCPKQKVGILSKYQKRYSYLRTETLTLLQSIKIKSSV